MCMQNMEFKGFVDPQNHDENVGQGMKFYKFSDRNVQRGRGYTRKALPGK